MWMGTETMIATWSERPDSTAETFRSRSVLCITRSRHPPLTCVGKSMICLRQFDITKLVNCLFSLVVSDEVCILWFTHLRPGRLKSPTIITSAGVMLSCHCNKPSIDMCVGGL